MFISTRRKFLGGASASVVAMLFSASEKAEARFPRGASIIGFSNGKSQGQSTSPAFSGDFPFINLLKSQLFSWQGTDSNNSGAIINPSWLDANGYPLASAIAGSPFGVIMGVSLPNQSSRPSNSSSPMVVTWVGNATIAIGNAPSTVVSGSTSAVLNGYGFSDGLYHGRYEWYPTNYDSSGNYSFQMNVVSIATGSSINKLQVYFLADETVLLAGEIFGTQFKSVLKQANFGAYRFMDWFVTSTSNMTTWGTRKSQAFPNWTSDEWRANLYGGATTNSGNDYTLSIAGGYSWPGYTSGDPNDKQTLHLGFNADATLVQNTQNNGTLTINSLSPITFGWNSHPLANGNIVSIGTGESGGNPMQNTSAGTNYYIVNAAANTFQISLTPGGSALVSTNAGGGAVSVTKPPTLKIGTTAFPLKDPGGNPLTDTNLTPYSGGATQIYGTVVFDAVLQCWLLSGANRQSFSIGLKSGIPPEICLQLCIEMGMYPHFSIPAYALDPATDFTKSLATYYHSTAPAWMKSHWEPGNEVWNGLTAITNIALYHSFAYWGSQDVGNWYGRSLSMFGQDIASVLGLGNLGVTYEVMCGVQTDGEGGSATFSATAQARLQSTDYVASGPLQSGYTQSAASGWTSAMLTAQYVSPSQRGQNVELETAWAYFVTNAGNPTAQAANLNTYADSLNDGVIGAAILTLGSPGTVNWPSHGKSPGDYISTNSTGTLPTGLNANGSCFVLTVLNANQFTVSASQSGGSAIAFTGSQSGTHYFSGNLFNSIFNACRYNNWHALGAANGVNHMRGYEGGYSPDLVSGGDWYSMISGASQASSCVLTLATTVSLDSVETVNGLSLLGNPAVAGMVLNIQNALGMTQLNCASPGLGNSATFSSGSANITPSSGAATPIVGQRVQFSASSNLPANITAGVNYYCVQAGSPFQISATKGGSAITAGTSPSGNYNNVGLATGWTITVVSGNSVTIDVNSTGFTAWASGGFQQALYLGSTAMVNNFRTDVLLFASDMQALTTANYNNFTAAGGLFPSQYELSGTNSVWPPIQPDVWGTQSGEFAAIVAYNK